jgi:hypothetical protein
MPALGLYISEIPLLSGNYVNGGKAVRPGGFGWELVRNMYQVLSVDFSLKENSSTRTWISNGQPTLATIARTGSDVDVTPIVGSGNPLIDIADDVEVKLATECIYFDGTFNVSGWLLMSVDNNTAGYGGSWELARDIAESHSWSQPPVVVFAQSWDRAAFTINTSFVSWQSNAVSLPAFP